MTSRSRVTCPSNWGSKQSAPLFSFRVVRRTMVYVPVDGWWVDCLQKWLGLFPSLYPPLFCFVASTCLLWWLASGEILQQEREASSEPGPQETFCVSDLSWNSASAIWQPQANGPCASVVLVDSQNRWKQSCPAARELMGSQRSNLRGDHKNHPAEPR